MTYTVCFAGNPNVGKSTLFNALTGLRQHTGNWTGKTVDPARGRWTLEEDTYLAVDLPGVYSLSGGTPEERVAADWLAANDPDCVVAVLDATALERTLVLALELRPRCRNLILCLNLMDEAERLGLRFDLPALSEAFSAPVVPTRADRKQSAEALRRTIAVACLPGNSQPSSGVILSGGPAEVEGSIPAYNSELSTAHYQYASALASAVCPAPARPRRDWDRILLGKWTAWPVALALLFAILYLTVRGANLPSQVLEDLLSRLGDRLRVWLSPLPSWLRELLTEGIYGTTAKVVAVMLPPMAIFFPLFSLLEDLGFLPRLAFLLDRPFARAGTCGRQGLCMCMGCGCNAVGVTGCRIIAEPKQRLAAILTNALTPCNGRFPTLFLLMGLLIGRNGSALEQAALLTGLLILSVLVTLGTTRLLRRTILKGEAGSFVLELPPFRRPRIWRLLIRSVLDRTLRILGRAVTAAAPAGAMIWILSQIRLSGQPFLAVLARDLDPAAAIIGLSGPLLLAFFLSFPANELLLPLTVLILGAGEGLTGELAAPEMSALLTASGMGPAMALCAMLFTLFHWPCATTVLTIRRETGSFKWTLFSILVPTAAGVLICAGVNLLLSLGV